MNAAGFQPGCSAANLQNHHENPFDLISMDVNTPTMGWLEATPSLHNCILPTHALTTEHGCKEIRVSMMAASVSLSPTVKATQYKG